MNRSLKLSLAILALPVLSATAQISLPKLPTAAEATAAAQGTANQAAAQAQAPASVAEASKGFRELLLNGTTATAQAVSDSYKAIGQTDKAKAVETLVSNLKSAEKKGDSKGVSDVLSKLIGAQTDLSAFDWSKFSATEEGKTLLAGAIKNYSSGLTANNQAVSSAKGLLEAIPAEIKANPLQALSLTKDLNLSKLFVEKGPALANGTAGILSKLTDVAKASGIAIPDTVKTVADAVSAATATTPAAPTTAPAAK